MVCRNLCERLNSNTIYGQSHYDGGKKYCRRCEVYYYNQSMFCPCCGMALRRSPADRRGKERLRQSRHSKELIGNNKASALVAFPG